MDIFTMARGDENIRDITFRYDALNEHHPIANAAIYWLVIQATSLFGASLDATIACLALFHMISLALSCSYCASTVFSATSSKTAIVFLYLFLSLNPIVALYSITVWKDVIFAASLLALLSLSARILNKPDEYQTPARLIPYAALLASTMLLRSNGIIAAAALAFGLLIALRKNEKKKLFACASLAALVIFAIAKGPICWGMGIQPAHFSETVGLPIQQIGNTVREEGQLDDEDRAFIGNIIPLELMKEAYAPSSANGIKFQSDFNDSFLDAHKVEFLNTWVNVGLQNPGSYLRAWCAQVLPLLYIDSSTRYFIGDVGYDLTGDGSNDASFSFEAPIGPESLYNFAQLYSTAFPFLFKPASLGWFSLFAAIATLIMRRKTACIVSLTLSLHWVGLLLSAPASDFRYMFPVMVCVPLVVILVIFNSDNSARGENNKVQFAQVLKGLQDSATSQTNSAREHLGPGLRECLNRKI